MLLNNKLEESYEVLIIGAGAAVLAAAMTMGRLRRRVLLCDDQKPLNEVSLQMNNFLKMFM